MSILITGGNSMLGRAISQILPDSLPITHGDIYNSSASSCDLLSYDSTIDLFRLHKPHTVIHCAGYNGNISFNSKYPAEIFYNTTQIALNVLNCAQRVGTKKIVSLLTSCAYPNQEEKTLVEKKFWDGLPNESVECHAFAKRMIQEYGRQLYKQYGTICVGIVFNTCYGPYDSFDIHKTKVVGGLIKKFVEAKRNGDTEVVCWGTGEPRRELIYVEDAARLAVLASAKYNDPFFPLNLGSGEDITIRELATTISELVGFDGQIIWDTTKPDGQMRKLLSNKKMKRLLGPQKFTPLREGLTKTIEWYNGRKSL